MIYHSYLSSFDGSYYIRDKSAYMDIVDVDGLLQRIEQALVSVVSNIEPSTFLDSGNGVILVLENILQQVITLQPLLCVQVSDISEVAENIKILIEELNGIDQLQRQSRCRGRPAVCITEPEMRNLLELHFTQVEIAKLFGCSVRTVKG